VFGTHILRAAIAYGFLMRIEVIPCNAAPQAVQALRLLLALPAVMYWNNRWHHMELDLTRVGLGQG